MYNELLETLELLEEIELQDILAGIAGFCFMVLCGIAICGIVVMFN